MEKHCQELIISFSRKFRTEYNKIHTHANMWLNVPLMQKLSGSCPASGSPLSLKHPACWPLGLLRLLINGRLRCSRGTGSLGKFKYCMPDASLPCRALSSPHSTSTRHLPLATHTLSAGYSPVPAGSWGSERASNLANCQQACSGHLMKWCL